MNYNDRLREAILDRAQIWPGWTVTWDHPGALVALVERYGDLECAATPGWDGEACPLQVSRDGEPLRNGHVRMPNGPHSWSGDIEADVRCWRLSVEAALCLAHGADQVRKLAASAPS